MFGWLVRRAHSHNCGRGEVFKWRWLYFLLHLLFRCVGQKDERCIGTWCLAVEGRQGRRFFPGFRWFLMDNGYCYVNLMWKQVCLVFMFMPSTHDALSMSTWTCCCPISESLNQRQSWSWSKFTAEWLWRQRVWCLFLLLLNLTSVPFDSVLQVGWLKNQVTPNRHPFAHRCLWWGRKQMSWVNASLTFHCVTYHFHHPIFFLLHLLLFGKMYTLIIFRCGEQ